MLPTMCDTPPCLQSVADILQIVVSSSLMMQQSNLLHIMVGVGRAPVYGTILY
jgi:hypothetical protein